MLIYELYKNMKLATISGGGCSTKKKKVFYIFIIVLKNKPLKTPPTLALSTATIIL